jgi:phosphate transport system substrate-binding protein
VRTPPDQWLSLVFAAGDSSYPLINYEYAVVSTRQANPETAAALREFLLWAISLTGGNAPKYQDAMGFIPLPDFIRALSQRQIDLIKRIAKSGVSYRVEQAPSPFRCFSPASL